MAVKFLYFDLGNVLLLLNCLRSRVGCRCCFELKRDIEEFELLRMGLFSCDVERLRLFELARKLLRREDRFDKRRAWVARCGR